ncbi:MAG: UvrD-helicase domain-containing protein [Deltaproteobacteria bacterium]|nr:UvrD-helicase domain-containing protein [Deltaproteobacteria bacterium]
MMPSSGANPPRALGPSSSPALWPSAGPLPPQARLFLEASAGTGKTFAIEGIVVQLVAEADLPIDKILVITFTNAATAELNDRVRQRLAAVLRVVQGHQPAGGDLVAERLAAAADGHLLAGRLTRALADIDRAPIATIHSFCQRMLQELAFESGQESELEVLGEAAEVREQLVADALAGVYARASEAQLAVAEDMGWSPGGLREVAKAMTGASEPRLRPAPESRWVDPLVAVVAWQSEVAALGSWWFGPEGRAAVAAWEAELQRPSKSAAKGQPHNRLSRGPKNVDAAMQTWLASGGLRGERPFEANTHWLDPQVLRSKWDASAGPAEQFGGYALAVRFEQACAVQDALWPQPLVHFAAGVRRAFQAEVDRRAQLTYDGMLSRLAERLTQERQAGTSALADAIRQRYRVALVDEFQDTDAAQWQALDCVFGRAGTRLLVVGDPKQSIYRFRGADLDVYLAARAQAECFQLGTNYRSDKPLVDALNNLWLEGNLPLSMAGAGSDATVRYASVAADKGLRVRDLPPSAGAPQRRRRPLEFRLCTAECDGGDPSTAPHRGELVETLAQLCADECQRLLESKATLLDKSGQERPLRPGDLAVLVASHREAATVAKYLAQRQIPAVTAARGSIFHSDAVAWLAAWLDAVANPASERPARLLAVSPLVGWTADQLTRAIAEPSEGAALDSDQLAWQALRQHVATLATLWPTQGFTRALDKTLAKFDALARLLGSVWGERGATDLRHLMELGQTEDRRTRAGPRGLAEWLRARMAAADDRSDEQATRLESDAAAVQLVTVHASKGLEYPVVLLPFAWPPRGASETGEPLLVRADGAAVLDLSARDTLARSEALRWSEAAAEAESVRLLYVAMTRARHHLVAWLNRYDAAAAGPLARLILQGDSQGWLGRHRPASDKKTPTAADKQAAWQAAMTARLDELDRDHPAGIGWSAEVAPAPARVWRPLDDQAAMVPQARTFQADLPLGSRWQVASFTSLSAGRGVDDDEPTRALAELGLAALADGAAMAAEVAADVAEVDLPALGDLGHHAWLLEPAAGAELPGGTATGDWIHGVFEELDFGRSPLCAKDGRSAAALVAELAQRFGIAPGPADPVAGLVGLLPHWLTTPLAATGALGLPRDFVLGALEPAHRLDELAFDLRLGAGADYRVARAAGIPAATGCLDIAGVRRAFAIGANAADFGGASWCQALLRQSDDQVQALLPEIAGFLTGFIDLTFRVGGHGAAARYYVVDYKSNAIRGPEWLAGQLAATARSLGRDAPRLANAHYTRPLLQWAMAHAGYHLQALVYTLALHRLLQSRLGDAYDYDRHVGGHLYLFLKGMAGPSTPRWQGHCLGVWADRWPRAAVLTLDRALLGRGSPAEVG